MKYLQGFWIACHGIPQTVAVSLLAVAFGAAIGLLVALMRLSENRLAAFVAKIYTDVVRGTPLVVQALIFAYGIPRLLQENGMAFKWPQLVIPAIIVCSLNSAAYMAEVIRSGIQAVDKGQMEAARSLGMPKRMAMRLIIIPQAIRIILPAIGNEFVTLIKETSVLSFVGVVETLRRGALWAAATYNVFEAYIGVACAYLLLTIPLTKLVGLMERRMSGAAPKASKNDSAPKQGESAAIEGGQTV